VNGASPCSGQAERSRVILFKSGAEGTPKGSCSRMPICTPMGAQVTKAQPSKYFRYRTSCSMCFPSLTLLGLTWPAPILHCSMVFRLFPLLPPSNYRIIPGSEPADGRTVLDHVRHKISSPAGMPAPPSTPYSSGLRLICGAAPTAVRAETRRVYQAALFRQRPSHRRDSGDERKPLRSPREFRPAIKNGHGLGPLCRHLASG